MKFSRFLYSLSRRSKVIREILVHSPLVPKTEDLKVPNLVIIGSQKSGTTSLHQYLGLHPEIFMPYFKEPGFFLNDSDEIVESITRRSIRLGLSDNQLLQLMHLGYQDEPWFGDSSTYYTMAPKMGAEVPQNISSRSPNARLIYILRDPYDRIISQFLWGAQNRFSSGELNEVVLKRMDMMSSISSYAAQLSNYLDYFPRDRICIKLFSDLKDKPTSVMNECFEFLKLSPLEDAQAQIDNLGKLNKSKERKKYDRNELVFTPEVQKRLSDLIEPQIDKLEAVTKLDLNHWKRRA